VSVSADVKSVLTSGDNVCAWHNVLTFTDENVTHRYCGKNFPLHYADLLVSQPTAASVLAVLLPNKERATREKARDRWRSGASRKEDRSKCTNEADENYAQ
jgi:hypothetical protein